MHFADKFDALFGVKFLSIQYRMVSVWHQALRIWNANPASNKTGTWAIPKKGSPGHAEVRRIMEELKAGTHETQKVKEKVEEKVEIKVPVIVNKKKLKVPSVGLEERAVMPKRRAPTVDVEAVRRLLGEGKVMAKKKKMKEVVEVVEKPETNIKNVSKKMISEIVESLKPKPTREAAKEWFETQRSYGRGDYTEKDVDKYLAQRILDYYESLKSTGNALYPLVLAWNKYKNSPDKFRETLMMYHSPEYKTSKSVNKDVSEAHKIAQLIYSWNVPKIFKEIAKENALRLKGGGFKTFGGNYLGDVIERLEKKR